ncbi:MAG: hypothetical protein KIC92_01620 [Clostridiales bacterium]|nr:hypothetical protein [Clostridiales bacterium]
MKKNQKGLITSILAISLTTIGFVSYKFLKSKYPDKFNNLKDNDVDLEVQEKNLKKSISKEITEKQKEAINNISTNDINGFHTGVNEDTNIPIVSNINLKEEPNNFISSDDNLQEDYINTISSDNSLQEDPNNTISSDTSLQEDPNNTISSDTSLQEDSNNTISSDDDLQEDSNNNLDELVENDNETIIMPDSYIEQEIRYQLCLNSDDIITKSILKKLERIEFFEINDNDMLYYCDFLNEYTNIKCIVIDSLNPLKYGNNTENSTSKYCLKNISPLNKLSYLEELSFNWGIENIDFSSLNNLPNLKKLEIKFGMLNDISFISNLKNLEYLEIMLSNNITDLSPIINLPNLNRLYLYSNKKIDTQILKNIENLKYAYINGESINI